MRGLSNASISVFWTKLPHHFFQAGVVDQCLAGKLGRDAGKIWAAPWLKWIPIVGPKRFAQGPMIESMAWLPCVN